MKRNNLIALILVCVITVSIILFCKAVYEDEDSVFDILYNVNDLTQYTELFIGILLYCGIFYDYSINTISQKSVIAYLARHEKSPPGNSLTFKTA